MRLKVTRREISLERMKNRAFKKKKYAKLQKMKFVTNKTDV